MSGRQPTKKTVAGRAENAGDLADLLGWVGLGALAQALPPSLSGGERQRAALARAIIMGPDVILADEPTGNLDSATGLAILASFDDLHARGMTILIVTHDEKIAERCQRVIRLRDGLIESDVTR